MMPEPAEPLNDELAQHRPGKDEMNFAEFPIALLTDRVPKGQKSIKFEDQIFDTKRKKLITRRRIIDGSEEYGLPTATDDAVILALIQLTKQKGNFEQRDVEFTRLELINLLGWADEGRNYERLKLSLIRIANVTYTYENAWWDNRQKSWVTKVFHILDTVEINDSRVSGQQKCLFQSRVTWGEVVFDSFQASFLRDIDFQLCLRLEHPIALRMYRFVGKRFHVKPEWIFELKEFAHDHMGLGQNYEGGTQIARKLRPAIAELETHGFLEPLPDEERFQKKGRLWSIRFVEKQSAAPVLGVPAPIDNVESVPPLVNALIVRGVTAKTASELVATKSHAAIAVRIEVFDWMHERKDKRLERSPSGYLVASIRDEYAAPKGFTSGVERQRKKDAQRLKEQAIAEQRQKQRDEAAREQAELRAVKAYLQTLTPEQLAQTENDAIESAVPSLRESLTTTLQPDMRKLLISRVVSDHIRQQLKTRAETEQAAEPRLFAV